MLFINGQVVVIKISTAVLLRMQVTKRRITRNAYNRREDIDGMPT